MVQYIYLVSGMVDLKVLMKFALSLSLLHLLHPRMHLWMIFKFSLLGDLILIGIEQDVNLEVGSDSVPQCCVNLLILGPFQAPIAALSLKYINHPAIILFYAPLYTEGDDFPLISCIITRISVQAAPLLPKVCQKTEGGGAPPSLSIWVLFLSLFSSLSTCLFLFPT